MKTRRSRTRAIKITSINTPDPDLAAELAVPLLLKFLAKKNAWRHSSDIALCPSMRAAKSRSLPMEACTWWKVDPAVNRADPSNNGKHLLESLKAMEGPGIGRQ